MFVIARRLTIFALTMTIFALSFAALVTETGRKDPGVRFGRSASCQYTATQNCMTAL